MFETLLKKYRTAENVQRHVGLNNVQFVICKALHLLSLHENVVFSVCVRMRSAAYLWVIMLSFISG